jgi:hypothetical protein
MRFCSFSSGVSFAVRQVSDLERLRRDVVLVSIIDNGGDEDIEVGTGVMDPLCGTEGMGVPDSNEDEVELRLDRPIARRNLSLIGISRS